MNKEFIPYEQALKLKKLGFNENCMFPYHSNNTEYVDSTHVELVNYNATEKLVSAVLYQQAFRFFREKYKLRFIIQSSMSDLGEYFKLIFPDGEYRGMAYPTYEEAELACLIKLIELAKHKIDATSQWISDEVDKMVLEQLIEIAKSK